jgi:hypothetical protein
VIIEEEYKNLPLKIREKLLNKKYVYSNEYFEYIKIINKKLVYIYDETYLIVFVITTKIIFKYGYSPYDPVPISEEKSDNYHMDFFLNESINSFVDKYNIMWINQPEIGSNFSTYPSNSKYVKFGNYIVSLIHDEDALWSNIHGKHKNVIRKAIKNKCHVEIGGKELLNDYYSIDVKLRKRQNLPLLKLDYYRKLLENMERHTLISVCYCNGAVQGAAFFYRDNISIDYIYGNSIAKPLSGSINYLHWATMLHAKKMGIKEYNFFGARLLPDENKKYYSIQRFKERFGGELRVSYLFKIVVNKYMYTIFKTILFLKNIARKCENKKDLIDIEFDRLRQ